MSFEDDGEKNSRSVVLNKSFFFRLVMTQKKKEKGKQVKSRINICFVMILFSIFYCRVISEKFQIIKERNLMASTNDKVLRKQLFFLISKHLFENWKDSDEWTEFVSPLNRRQYLKRNLPRSWFCARANRQTDLNVRNSCLQNTWLQ